MKLRCCVYCLKETKTPLLFDLLRDKDYDKNRFVSDGRQMINVAHQKYRTSFGTALKYDPSGEDNFPEGIAPQKTEYFILDGKQYPKFTAEMNHPGTIQRATCSIHYGVNSDV